ncbi:hypothetical protein SEA_SAPO_18 [Gordonia phage Sapo]|nr:hypothetical protein SEA_SAPO_18 [Gordonia phage Sapo]
MFYWLYQPERPEEPAVSTKTQTPAVPATEKQLAFVDSLLDEWVALKDELGELKLTPADVQALKDSYRLQARKAVSAGIDAFKESNQVLKLRARKAGRRATAAPAPVAADLPSVEEVPAGFYAVETGEGATNELAFYKVDRPTEGRWAGYVFVKLQVSDDLQRLSRDAGHAVVRKVAEVGAANASARYGHELGVCGVCGRTLTNDASRAAGIGPKCAEKF